MESVVQRVSLTERDARIFAMGATAVERRTQGARLQNRALKVFGVRTTRHLDLEGQTQFVRATQGAGSHSPHRLINSSRSSTLTVPSSVLS